MTLLYSRWPRRSPSHCTSCLLSVCCCGLIVFVVDLFHPFNDLAVQGFLNGDMRRRRCQRGAMPMLFSCRAPDHIAGSYFLFWGSFALHPTASRRDDQSLPERMRMPR